MNNYIVDVHGLNKSFEGKPAVINLSLQIKKGEIFGFLGPNGSGKTTTIRMMCGLLTPDSGQGKCLGYDIITQSREIKQRVGYVPQAFSLYQDLTVRENLEFISRVYQVKDASMRVKKIMQELGLEAYQSLLAGKLSGGWKQRLSLAAALIHDPKLLLLDEPTAGVDPKARRAFWDEINTLTAQGMSVLVSTHYMDEAERCNRLSYIINGHLMAQGTVTEIIQKSKLIAWSAKGPDILKLLLQIKNQPGIEQAVVLGNDLRICGSDAALMQKTMTGFSDYAWQPVEANLEEVFIHFVHQNAENGL